MKNATAAAAALVTVVLSSHVAASSWEPMRPKGKDDGPSSSSSRNKSPGKGTSSSSFHPKSPKHSHSRGGGRLGGSSGKGKGGFSSSRSCSKYRELCHTDKDCCGTGGTGGGLKCLKQYEHDATMRCSEGLGPMPGETYYTADGSGNNIRNPSWGAANQPFHRRGLGPELAPALDATTNPRNVSNTLMRGTPTGEIGIAGGFPLPVTVTPETTVRANIFREAFAQSLSHETSAVLSGFDLGTPTITQVYEGDVLYRPPCTEEPSEDAWNCFNASDASNYPLGSALGPNFMLTSPTLKTQDTDTINKLDSYLNLGQLYGPDLSLLRINYTDPGHPLVPHGKLYTTSQSWTPPFPGAPALGPFDGLPPSFSQVKPGEPAPSGLSNPDDALYFGNLENNNNAALTFVTVTWYRYHNVLCDEIIAEDPHLTSDEVFDQARRRNIAQFQKVTWYEYLPAALGKLAKEDKMKYRGYNSHLDASTSVPFDVALRYGHSTIVPWRSVNASGAIVPTTLDGVNFSDFVINSGFQGGVFGFTAILASNIAPPATSYEVQGLGSIVSPAGESDIKIGETLRNLAFVPNRGIPVQLGLGVDLAAVDVIRSRDMGAPAYAVLRERYWAGEKYEKPIYGRGGCHAASETTPSPDPIECFDLVTGAKEGELSAQLRQYYGKVSNIPAFVGLMSEPLEDNSGSSFGGTISGIVLEEYTTKRDGDRFWFENEHIFEKEELHKIMGTTMRDVLLKTGINAPDLPEDVFFTPPDDSPLNAWKQ